MARTTDGLLTVFGWGEELGTTSRGKFYTKLWAPSTHHALKLLYPRIGIILPVGKVI